MYLQIHRRVKLEKKKKNALIALQIFTEEVKYHALNKELIENIYKEIL